MRDSLGGAVWTVLFGLMALLMSSGAGAIDLDAEDRVATTYAKETLTDPTTGTKDRATYYKVNGDPADTRVLYWQAKIGIAGATGQRMVVMYTLGNMVFADDSSAMLATAAADAECPTSGGIPPQVGGASGDNSVGFVLDASTAADLTRDHKACLRVDALAISATAAGSVTFMTRSEDTLLPAMHEKRYANVVRAVPALVETATPMSPTATVTTGFKSFGDKYRASVGTFEIMAMPYLVASTGLAAVLANLADTAGGDEGSMVTFSGNFGFAKKVTLEDGALSECPAASSSTPDLLMRDDEGMVSDTMELAPVAPGALISVADDSNTENVDESIVGAKHLCIYVPDMDDEMMVTIPETGAYMVMTEYVDGTPRSKFPPPNGRHSLGMIMRDGTTVRIPYLTQFADYNQRIAITNRGGAAAYEFSFKTEDGVTAMPGADATGMLEADSVKYISLRYDDLVTIEGPFSRAVATLTVVADERQIDVVVSQTNANGGTDTIEYTDN